MPCGIFTEQKGKDKNVSAVRIVALAVLKITVQTIKSLKAKITPEKVIVFHLLRG